MAEIKVLKHSVVIKGKSFDDCKAEFDRVCNGVKKDFGVECNMNNLIFSDMTEREDECIAVFRVPESKQYSDMENCFISNNETYPLCKGKDEKCSKKIKEIKKW